MAETFTLIGGRSNKQGTSLCIGKLGAEYMEVTSTVEMNTDDMARLGVEEGGKLRLRSMIGETIVSCKGKKPKDLPGGLLFIAYGPNSSQLMGSDTAGTGMPISKNIEVEVEVIEKSGAKS
jgi:formylmethanofuran dehydrogenase subunit D